MKTIHTPHDHFFKAAMADIRVAREFLANYLSPAMVGAMELDSLLLMPNSYVDKALKMVLSDVVYQVKLKAGETAYIYCLCEHQSTCDPLMPFRIWQYVINIWADHIKQNKGKATAQQLPLIVPVVFYSGEEIYTGATDIRHLIQAPAPLIEEALFKQTFKLIDLNQLSDDVLKQQQWAGMMALMMRHIRDRDIVLFLRQIIDSLRQLEQAGGTDFVVLLLNYCLNTGEALDIEAFVSTVQQGLSHTTGDKVMTIAEQLIQKGKLEGEVKGEAKAKRAVVVNGFKQGLSIAVLQQLTGLSQSELETIKKTMIH